MAHQKTGLIDFHIIQVITGHGCFVAYLKKYGKLETHNCWFCGQVTDNANHTLFICDAWNGRRTRLQGPFNPKTMVPRTLLTKGIWNAVSYFIQKVLESKETKERRRQNTLFIYYNKRHIYILYIYLKFEPKAKPRE